MVARRLYVPDAMPSRDANGRARRARLAFYDPGSAYSTLKTVYADDTLTTPLAQPVDSDSYGRFPQIWADEAETFDAIYSDAVTSAQIRAYEGLTPLSDVEAASVALAEAAADAAEAAKEDVEAIRDDLEPLATAVADAQAAALTATTKAGEASDSADDAQDAADDARAYMSALYLGSKTNDPSTDNDGNPLVAGAQYFNSVTGMMMVYTGIAWQVATTGDKGDNGWSPVFALVADGSRRVLQVDDWVGGEGTKPATGDYVGPSGLTADISQAVDVRGVRGFTGPTLGVVQGFSAATADADPGAGKVRFNHATPASVTELYVSDDDAGGADVSAYWDALDASTNPSAKGELTVRQVSDPSRFLVFEVTGAVTAATGYRKVPVAHVAGDALPDTDAEVGLGFARAGDKGADGAGTGDVSGPAGATDNALVRWDGATGKLVKDSSATLSDGGDLALAGALTVGGAVILPADPSAAMEAATKQYVDNAASGLETALLRDITRMALALAELRANQLVMPNGLADDFADGDGIDLAGSTGATYDAGGKRVTNVTTGSAPANMTGPTSPAGYEMRASSTISSSFEPWMARNGVTATTGSDRWASNGVGAAWIEAKLPAAARFPSYTISVPDGLDAGVYEQMPRDWTLWGSNSPMGGAGGDLLDTQSGLSWSSSGQSRTFVLTTPNAYQYYELRITANNGNTIAHTLTDWRFPASLSSDMDLRSAGFSALAAPGRAHLVIVAKADAAYALNTDLKAYASRDGGGTWTQASLSVREEVAGGYAVLEGLEINLGAQPPGTTMKWRVEGVVTRSWDITGVGLFWN